MKKAILSLAIAAVMVAPVVEARSAASASSGGRSAAVSSSARSTVSSGSKMATGAIVGAAVAGSAAMMMSSSSEASEFASDGGKVFDFNPIEHAEKVKHGFVLCTDRYGKTKPKSTGCEITTKEPTEGFFDREVTRRYEWNDYVKRVTGIKNSVVTGVAFGYASGGESQAVVYFIYPSE